MKIRKRVRSFGYAFKGLVYVFRTQPNMQIHLGLFLLAVLMGFLFRITALEWVALIMVSGLVIAMETLNTAIETYLDKHHSEKDKTTGYVKDLSAAAVLITAIAALIIGLIIFLPEIFALL